jgi:hypothetical protein
MLIPFTLANSLTIEYISGEHVESVGPNGPSNTTIRMQSGQYWTVAGPPAAAQLAINQSLSTALTAQTGTD